MHTIKEGATGVSWTRKGHQVGQVNMLTGRQGTYRNLKRTPEHQKNIKRKSGFVCRCRRVLTEAITNGQRLHPAESVIFRRQG